MGVFTDEWRERSHRYLHRLGGLDVYFPCSKPPVYLVTARLSFVGHHTSQDCEAAGFSMVVRPSAQVNHYRCKERTSFLLVVLGLGAIGKT